MEKYIISNREFQVYFLMLKSEDITIVKQGVQKFSDAFAMSRHILNSNKREFCRMLEQLLENRKYESIYKWIYKCTCFYCTERIKEICKKNFFITHDSETRNWIISTIASFCNDNEEFIGNITELREKSVEDDEIEILDKKNLFYNVSLFGKFSMEANIKIVADDIVRKNDINGMYWMSKLAAYSNLAKRKNLDKIVQYEDIDMLTYSANEQVQVYAYWGMVHRINGNLILKKEEPKKYLRTEESLKWYYAGIIPGEYACGNYEFIEEILKQTENILKNNVRAKDGILIGINSIPYKEQFDSLLIEWYYGEESEKIKIGLLEYFVKNVENNKKSERGFGNYGSFFMIIQDELKDIVLQNYIINYIILYNSLELRNKADSIEILYKKSNSNENVDLIPVRQEKSNMEIFMGSSLEAKNYMDEIAVKMEELGVTPLLWNAVGKNIFIPGTNTIDALIDITKRVQAAVFIFNADDKRWNERSALEISDVVRDNVLFEYGLFTGALGKERVCFVCKGKPQIASDLKGITYIDGEVGEAQVKLKLRDWINAIYK